VRGQQLITPGDRRVDRLLALGEIAPADGGEQDIVCELAEQILGGEYLHPRSRELEGERQGIEPPTNRRHGWSVRGGETELRLYVPSPLHEESHRRRTHEIGGRRGVVVHVQREWSHGVLPLASHTERSAAGGQHAEGGDRLQQIRNQRRRVQ